MASIIRDTPLGELDYVEIADADTLEPQTVCGPDSRLFGALRFRRARLIDNVGVPSPSASRSEGPSHG
jgi:pantothenate synthetase